jgi:hypothetical protein
MTRLPLPGLLRSPGSRGQGAVALGRTTGVAAAPSKIQPMRILALVSVAALALTASPGSAAGPTAPLVRPGLTYTVGSSGCSFAFLFRGSDGRDYAATAAHCVLEADGRQLWRGDAGPSVLTPDGRAIGRFAYARLQAAARPVEDVDFAFIRLDRGLFGNPQMCAWGGPTAMLTTEVSGRTELHHNGGGQVVSDVAPTRTAVTDRLPRTPRVHALGAVAFGDSGSGTTTADGTAVGINVTVEPYLQGDAAGTFVYSMGLQRLDLAVAEASKVLGVRLSLRTAPLAPTPLPTQRC